MPEVIPHDQLDSYIEETIRRTYKGLQKAKGAGLPTIAVEEFIVDAVIVTTNGLGSIVVDQVIDEVEPVKTEENRPETRQKSTSKRRTTGRTDGRSEGSQTGTDTANDTSTDRNIGTSVESSTDTQTNDDSVQTDDTKQYGNIVNVETKVDS